MYPSFGEPWWCLCPLIVAACNADMFLYSNTNTHWAVTCTFLLWYFCSWPYRLTWCRSRRKFGSVFAFISFNIDYTASARKKTQVDHVIAPLLCSFQHYPGSILYRLIIHMNHFRRASGCPRCNSQLLGSMWTGLHTAVIQSTKSSPKPYPGCDTYVSRLLYPLTQLCSAARKKAYGTKWWICPPCEWKRRYFNSYRTNSP